MEDIITHARELGKKIAAHPRCSNFMNATRKVSADPEAQRILGEYQQQVAKLRQLEAEQKPVEVDDKQKLSSCETAVAGSEPLKEMMKHQADYVEMMTRINSAIDEAVQQAES